MDATFSLSDNFVSQFKGKQPKWGPLGEVTYRRTYSRQKEDGSYEEFWETLRRVTEGTYAAQKSHCELFKLPWNGMKAQWSAQEMFQRMWDFKFLPPGRGLWAMGTEFIQTHGGAALNNCGFISTNTIKVDFAEPFRWCMDMSMLGVGVGFDTRGAGTVTIIKPKMATSPFVVPDTREGWCDLIVITMNSFTGAGTLPTEVDYSQIRPEGTPIKGFGGVASGPTPLQRLHANVIEILTGLIGKKITSTAIVDLFNAIGVCVVAGNIRRSAMIAIGNPEDQAFLDLKNPAVNSRRMERWGWASNNTIFAEVGMDYKDPAEHTKNNGEIGYFWLNNARQYGRMVDGAREADMRIMGCNPCGEQGLEDRETCCLCETFPSNCTDIDDYKRTLKFAYLYAKTVTLIPTHSPRTNAVMLRNRRIGTSQSGIVQSVAKLGFRKHMEWSELGYYYIQNLDVIYSNWLCVPKSIKTTSIKPSGTVSLLPGVTPGIHYPEAEYYWRTIRFSNTSGMLQGLKEKGYRIEPGEGGSSIVYFPVKESNFTKAKSEVSIWEQLELAAQMQYYWADNQVSVTISFKPEEAGLLPQALSMYETRLKAVSFLPLLTQEQMEEKGYKHPPYQAITKEVYENDIKQLNATQLESHHEVDDQFCDSDKCRI